MIQNEAVSEADVSHHYDELDEFYRELWGVHLHHGLWKNKQETKEQAVENLSLEVLSMLNPLYNKKLVDIGCGYGESSRLAVILGAKEVTGITLSKKQYHYAKVNSKGLPVQFVHGNWLTNKFENHAFDGAFSIECFSHITDKRKFFDEVKRTLKPGAPFAMTAWLTSDRTNSLSDKFLLEPICEEGRLPSLYAKNEVIKKAEESGLKLIQYRDLSSQVWRTWTISSTQVMKLVTQERGFKYFLNKDNRERAFALTVMRILLGYKVGAFKYGLFVFKAL